MAELPALELVVLLADDEDEEFAREEEHDDDVVDHEDEHHGDEDEAEDVPHLRLHVTVEHKHQHGEQVQCAFIEDVLVVYYFLLPLILGKSVTQHDQCHSHED